MNEPTPGAAAREPRSGSGALVVLLGAITAIGPLSIDLYLPSLPIITHDLAATPSQSQGTVSAFLAGMAIGQLFYGPLSDRTGRRAPILAGLLIFCLGSAACALATSPNALLAARFLQALGGCAGVVVGRAVVRDRFDHVETARVLSLMMMVVGLAPILAPLIGGWILAWGGWRMNFWVLSAYGAASVAAALVWLKESRSAQTAAHASTEHPVQAYLSLLKEPRLIGYILGAGFNAGQLFVYISASPGLIIGTYGVSPSNFGYFFGANALGMVVMNQVNRALLRRWTPDQVLSRGSLFCACVAVTLGIASLAGHAGPFVMLPGLFLIMSSFGVMQGNSMAGALNVDPRRAGAISALVGGLSFGFGGAISAIAALLHDGTPRPLALTLAAAAVTASVCFHAIALRRK